jgi:hypothetical protein
MNILSKIFKSRRVTHNNNTNDHKLDISLSTLKTLDKLRSFWGFLSNHVEYLIKTEKSIKDGIPELAETYNQPILEEQFTKELWINSYINVHKWFFDLMEPQNNEELALTLDVVSGVFERTLEKHDKKDYMLWLNNGLNNFYGKDKLIFNDPKLLDTLYTEQLAKRFTTIAYEVTEGRLGGKLYEGVLTSIMLLMKVERKQFLLEEDLSLSEEDIEEIGDIIDSMKLSQEDVNEAFISTIKETFLE